jgi:endogenous inhibitor of DNA gyrase (YacG/DUF329 family)
MLTTHRYTIGVKAVSEFLRQRFYQRAGFDFMKCPICEKPTTWKDNPFRPFCSERCKLIDFGHWVDEDYGVPSEEAAPDEIISAPPEKRAKFQDDARDEI